MIVHETDHETTKKVSSIYRLYIKGLNATGQESSHLTSWYDRNKFANVGEWGKSHSQSITLFVIFVIKFKETIVNR